MATLSQTLDFQANDRSLEQVVGSGLSSTETYTLFQGTFRNSGRFEDSTSVNADYFYDLGLGLDLVLEGGSLGHVDLAYPIDTQLTFPDEVPDAGTFQVSTPDDFTVGEANVSGETLNFGELGLDLRVSSDGASVDNVTIFEVFGQPVFSPDVSFAFDGFPEITTRLATFKPSVGSEVEVIDGITFEVASPQGDDITTETTSSEDTPGTLTPVTAEGSDTLASIQANPLELLDEIPQLAPLDILTEDFQFPLPGVSGDLEAEYTLLAPFLKAGYDLVQQISFLPEVVNTTIKVGEQIAEGKLGDVFDFQAPSTTIAELDGSATYDIAGALEVSYALEPSGSIGADILGGSVSVAGQNLNYGPVFSPEISGTTEVGGLTLFEERFDLPDDFFQPIVRDFEIGGDEESGNNTTIDITDDFVSGSTQDTQVTIDVERSGDTSYPIDLFVDGEVFTDNAFFTDTEYTLQPGPSPEIILSADVAEVIGDIRSEVQISEQPEDPRVEIGNDTATVVLFGDQVDDRGGLAFGDPHLTTFDNVAYDFQAAGDFVLARATEGPEYEVQARFTALSSAVSATTAMATSVDGTAISVESSGSDGTLRIGGTVTELGDGESISVGPGTVSRSGQSIDIDHGNGDETSVDIFDTFLNVVPSPSLARTPGSGEGLLGNADGDPGNEFQLADGTVLSTPVPVDTLYGEYAQDWQVAQGNSLLPGAAEPFDAPDRIVTLDSLPDNVRAAAEEAVASANIENEVVREAAILDFALTGNEAFIDAAAQVDESFDPIVDTVPVDPVNDPAIVLTTDRTTLNEEDAAARTATFTVSRGSTDGDLTVNYASAGVGEAPADASDFANDSGSGQVLIEDGQESASFKVKIADDMLDEGTEAFNTSISLEEDQAPDYEVLVSSFRTTIEDADEGMALNEVRGTDGRDNLRGTDGPDQMISLGGSYDRMAGSGGADEFIFGAEATNGVRERDVISNFDVAEDSIVLRDGASVADSRERADTVVLSLDDGNDVAYIRGDGVSLDTVNIVDENLLV